MKGQWLSLNGKQFDLALPGSLFPAEPSTAFEQATLDFCRRWLGGQQHFSIATSDRQVLRNEFNLPAIS